MIIKSLYIEKFGGIVDKRVELENSVNIICADNESGKSTIAEFIKIMLFGIGKSPQNIRSNERTRYMPWGEKCMGGEITVTALDTDYIIIRSFGKRKSDDTVNVINAITGVRENELCIESPGDILLGIGRDGFEKSLYIKQLSSKIEAGKDDEILKKLINLAQSGDEGVSFQRAVQILDSAAKELNGTRPRGKMLTLQDEITSLLTQKTIAENKAQLHDSLTVKLKAFTDEKLRLEMYRSDKSKLNELKEQHSKLMIDEATKNQTNAEKERLKASHIKSLFLQLIISCVFCFALIIIKPVFSIPFLVWAVMVSIIAIKAKNKKIDYEQVTSPEIVQLEIENLENELLQKEKSNTNRLVEVAQQIGDIQNQLNNIEILPLTEFDSKISENQSKYQQYSQNVTDIALAKKCLQDAFDELQKSFGKRLNDETSAILKEITGGKYSEVLVDNDYNMMVRIAQTNELQDAQYLSNGTYDQIYFALRMGIITMLFNDAPVILDEAFVQYDDNRLKLVLDYIKKEENRQFLLFSCHNRESEIFNSSKVL